MASEKSFLDRFQRAGELGIAVAAMTPVYAPADTKFSLATFTTVLRAAEAANAAVDAARPPYQDQVSDRFAVVKSISPRVTQALAYVKSNTGWLNRLDAVKKAANKVRGMSPGKSPANPDEDAENRESGERGYVEIAALFKAFIDRLEVLPAYAPQDPRIGIDALTAMWTGLDALNKSIPALARTLADAIGDRQDAFTGPAGLKAVFVGSKVSVKGQYGHASAQFQAIRGIKW